MKHVNHFKIHMRTHRDFNGDSSNPLNGITEKKKQFLCSTCGRACTSRSNLAVHTRRHTGTMTNFCKICGKGYPRSTDLTIHMRWASNDNIRFILDYRLIYKCISVTENIRERSHLFVPSAIGASHDPIN